MSKLITILLLLSNVFPAFAQGMRDCRESVPASPRQSARVSFMPIGDFGKTEFDKPNGKAFRVLDERSWAYTVFADVIYTIDSGVTYKRMYNGIQRGEFRDPFRFVWYSYDTMLIANSHKPGKSLLQITTDRGATWSDIQAPDNGKGLTLMEGNSKGLVVAQCERDTALMISPDRGGTWRRVLRPKLTGDTYSYVNHCTVTENGWIYASLQTSSTDAIARSSDLGETWDIQPVDCRADGPPYLLPDNTILYTMDQGIDIDSTGWPTTSRRFQVVNRMKDFTSPPAFVLHDSSRPYGQLISLAVSGSGVVMAGSTRLMHVSPDWGKTWIVDSTLVSMGIEPYGFWNLYPRVQSPSVFLAVRSLSDSIIRLDYRHLVDPSSVGGQIAESECAHVGVYDVMGRRVLAIRPNDQMTMVEVRSRVALEVGRGAYICVSGCKTELIFVE